MYRCPPARPLLPVESLSCGRQPGWHLRPTGRAGRAGPGSGRPARRLLRTPLAAGGRTGGRVQQYTNAVCLIILRSFCVQVRVSVCVCVCARARVCVGTIIIYRRTVSYKIFQVGRSVCSCSSFFPIFSWIYRRTVFCYLRPVPFYV